MSWLKSLSAVILEPRKIKSVTAFTFPFLFAMKWWDWMPWSLFLERWLLSQLFQPPLSSSSRGSVVWCSYFIFLDSKITADSDCSHEIKRHLPLGRNAMTNLGTTLKSRDITLPTKFCIVKAMVFPVVMYGCGSWTIKKAECCPLLLFSH